MLCRKRGQITIFIILGIMVLAIVSLLIYYNFSSARQAIAKRPAIEEIPTELMPLRMYIQDCLKSTAANGLLLIGQQAGYIEPEKYGRFSFIDPTDSDGIQFSRESSLKIPYWWYNKNLNKENKIKFASMMPELYRKMNNDMSIESQLDRYTASNLKKCILNFTSFKEQGFEIIEKAAPKVTTSVAPGIVSFYLEYSLSAKKGNIQSNLKNFIADISLDLVSIYNTAANITAAESRYAFLERNTLSLLESFSGLEKEDLPPMVDSQFEFGKMSLWMSKDVKIKIQSMLTSYIPLLRFYNSRNFERYEFPEDEFSDVKQRIYDNMILDLGYPVNYDIAFDYLGFWPMYFDVNDNGEVIMPQAAAISFAGINFGLQRYNTVYDISYPVMVTLYDPSAMNGKGYVFNFALESNIRNNAPVSDKETILGAAETFEDSLFGNENQRNSGEITITVKDSYTLKPLQGVQLTFTADDQSAFIGETDKDGKFTGKLPIAYGGLVTLLKENYITKSMQLDTEIDKSASLEAQMDIIKVVNIAVRKMQLSNVGKTSSFPFTANKTKFVFNSLSYPLLDAEQAVISLRRINSPFEDEFSTGAVVTGAAVSDIRLAPGIYEVIINNILNEQVIIPEEEIEGVKIPEISFDTFPNGGLVWDNSSTYWTVSPNNVYNSNSITFYIVTPGIADTPEYQRTHDDLELMGKTSEFSGQYREELEPTYG